MRFRCFEGELSPVVGLTHAHTIHRTLFLEGCQNHQRRVVPWKSGVSCFLRVSKSSSMLLQRRSSVASWSWKIRKINPAASLFPLDTNTPSFNFQNVESLLTNSTPVPTSPFLSIEIDSFGRRSCNQVKPIIGFRRCKKIPSCTHFIFPLKHVGVGMC